MPTDPWSAIQGAGLGVVALSLLLAAVKWLWDRKEKVEEKGETNRDKTIDGHDGRLTAVEKAVTELRLLHTEGQKDFGRLEVTTERLQEKLEGLQTFWRQEFEKFSDKMTQGMDRLRTDVRKDFEEHRQLVHERMAKATHDMIETVQDVMTKQTKGKKS